jgi:thiol:disulfide interchange protein DsbC
MTHSTKLLAGLLLTAGLVSSAMAAQPGAELVKASLTKAIPQVAIQKVSQSEAEGIYEVVAAGKEIVYVTQDGQYMFTGDMVELGSKRNVTQERRDELGKIDFSQLPLDKAIKYVKGAGTYKLAVFSDPDCPYCKRFEKELEKLTDATVYIFTFPLDMHPNATEKSIRAWCSDDQAKAWQNMVLNDVMPEAKPDCPNPVNDVKALARKLGVNGTPTVFMANGMKLSPGTPGDVIQKRISQGAN